MSLIEDEKGRVGLKKKEIERKRWMADVDEEPRGRDCVIEYTVIIDVDREKELR